MKTSPVTPQDFSRSVIAVPPLAMNGDLTLNPVENAKIAAHIEAGGVTSIVYGGNANFYGIDSPNFERFVDMAPGWVSDECWLIPSVGPDYGRLMEHARRLKHTAFPCAMALPMMIAASSDGVAGALRRFADAAGMPVIVYVKTDCYLAPAAIAALAEEGVLVGLKYAVPRNDLRQDPYLAAIVDAFGRDRIASGAGEHPGIVHMRTFGLAGFTSGCVCIAPAVSQALLKALQNGEDDAVEQFEAIIEPLESLRTRHGLINVLHDAVDLAGIAETGPILPMLANLGPELRATVAPAAQALLEAERAARRAAAA